MRMRKIIDVGSWKWNEKTDGTDEGDVMSKKNSGEFRGKQFWTTTNMKQ